MDDQLRVNPYSGIADKVRAVKDDRRQQHQHRREDKREPEEPHDVIEIGEEEPIPVDPDLPEDADSGLDLRT